MKDNRISAMVAISENRVIGKNNDLVFHIPEDFIRMKKITTGHPIIMGRKTFESIGRPLPNRTNIVITRDLAYKAEGAIVVNSLEDAVEEAKKALRSEEIFIFGGGQIFQEAMPIIDRLYLTVVHKNVDGDVYFPDYSDFTKVIEKEDHASDEFSYTFLTLERN